MKQPGLILLLVGVTAVDAGTASSPAECTVAALQQKAPADTTVTAAAIVPAEGTTPEYCRVDGHVATPGNTVSFQTGTAGGVEREVPLRGRRRLRRLDWLS